MAQEFELKLINFRLAFIRIMLSVPVLTCAFSSQTADLAKGHARSRSKFAVTSVRSRFPNTSSIFSEKGTEVSITVSVGKGTVCPKAKNVERQHKTAMVNLVLTKSKDLSIYLRGGWHLRSWIFIMIGFTAVQNKFIS